MNAVIFVGLLGASALAKGLDHPVLCFVAFGLAVFTGLCAEDGVTER